MLDAFTLDTGGHAFRKARHFLRTLICRAAGRAGLAADRVAEPDLRRAALDASQEFPARRRGRAQGSASSIGAVTALQAVRMLRTRVPDRFRTGRGTLERRAGCIFRNAVEPRRAVRPDLVRAAPGRPIDTYPETAHRILLHAMPDRAIVQATVDDGWIAYFVARRLLRTWKPDARVSCDAIVKRRAFLAVLQTSFFEAEQAAANRGRQAGFADRAFPVPDRIGAYVFGSPWNAEMLPVLDGRAAVVRAALSVTGAFARAEGRGSGKLHARWKDFAAGTLIVFAVHPKTHGIDSRTLPKRAFRPGKAIAAVNRAAAPVVDLAAIVPD